LSDSYVKINIFHFAMGKKQSRKRGAGGAANFARSVQPMMSVARSPTTLNRVVLSTIGTLSSDGAGVLAGAFTMDPSAASKWSQYSSIYDQFRVLGGVLKIASCPSNGAASLNSICRFAFDNDSSGTPTSYTDVANYSEITDIPVTWSSGAIRTVAFRRPVRRGQLQVTTSQWLDEQTPSSSLGALKFYASGLTASTLYWHYILDYLVEWMYRS
jgi:hypothetical protein